MKTKLFYCLTCLSIAAASILYGCKKKDDPKDFTNADYAGTWSVSDQCNSTTTFNMTAAASGSNGVTFTNFHGGFTINGTVSGNTLTIASQNATSATLGGPYTFSGSGTLNSASSLTITYSFSAVGTSGSVNCTSTCTK